MKDISAAAIALEKQAAYLSQSVGSTVTSSGDQLAAAVVELKAHRHDAEPAARRLQDPRAALLGPSSAQRGPGE